MSGSKILSLIAALALFAGMLLTACGTPSQPAPTQAELAATQPEPTRPEPTVTPTSVPPTATPLPPTPTDIPPTETAEPPAETAPPEESPVDGGPSAPGPDDASLTALTNVNIRSGPGTGYAVYGFLLPDQQVKIIGKSADERWWVIELLSAPLGQAWVSGEFAETQKTKSVPVIDPPPLPPVVAFSEPPAEDPNLTILDTVYVRAGPGGEYPAFGVAPERKIARVVGRTEDNQWWVIYLGAGTVGNNLGWVPAAYARTKNTSNTWVTANPPVPEPVAVDPPAEDAPIGLALTTQKLRGGPGLEYPLLGVVARETLLELTGVSQNGEWYQVLAPETISEDGFAWISARLVQPAGAENLPVTEAPPVPELFEPFPGDSSIPNAVSLDPLMVRSGPGLDYPTYGMVASGVRMQVLGISPDRKWYVVRIPIAVDPSGQAWVKVEDVEADETQGVPVVEPPPKP